MLFAIFKNLHPFHSSRIFTRKSYRLDIIQVHCQQTSDSSHGKIKWVCSSRLIKTGKIQSAADRKVQLLMRYAPSVF